LSLYERFLARVDESPDAIAVVDGERSLSYMELAREAAQLEARLAEAGVCTGSLVGLRLPRCAAVVIAIIGILRRGCAYVPIDPGYPLSRQRLIADEAHLGVIVESRNGILIPSRTDIGAQRPDWDLPLDAAYVIFTSGSTGRPKGVIVGNGHVLALIDACKNIYNFSPADAWTLFHSHSFDFSVWELWGALLNGARTVVVPDEAAADPWHFADLLAEQRVTVLNQVPTAFSHLVAALGEHPRPLAELRYVIFGGEALHLSAVRRWVDVGYAPGARLVNMYGITETTVHVTHCQLTEEDLTGNSAASPIGTPLPHLQIQLIAGSRLVPPGAPGEILVSGDSVSYGYLGRPDLTAEHFVTLPDGSGIAYRSGDWAVADARGRLRFIGRRDRQVKVRGFRIEPGEIEAAIGEHPAVAQCAVITTASRLGEPMLVAHYACWPATAVEPGDLRDHLARQLPPYMMPARVHRQNALPLTHHGKIDLAALA
jgi:nonribosomal peptide synthetase DhbF